MLKKGELWGFCLHSTVETNVNICRLLFLFVMRLENGGVSDTPEKLWLSKAGLGEMTKLYFSHKNIP